MALDAFSARLGTTQGRLAADDAPDGNFVFVLGDDQPGRIHELAPGDHAEVTQLTDLTGVDFVRATLKLRVPTSIPAGLAWEAAIVVDGNVAAAASTTPGRERTLTDLAANVSKLSGMHAIGFRLSLVTA
ncbi:MAG: hypothetical protein AB7S68_17390 [Polyangiaceae bacterium]